MARKFGNPPAHRDPLAYTDVRLANTPTVDFKERDPNNLDKNYPIQTIGRNSTTMDEWILVGFNSSGAIWVKFVGGGGDVITLSDDADTTVNPDGNGNIKIAGLGETETIASLNTVSISSPRTAKFVVDPDVSGELGTQTTIIAALALAVSGETIFIRPGTYTEDITLKAGVNLVAYIADGRTPNVTILGKTNASYTGTASISGVALKTNGDFALDHTGTNATVLNIINSTIDGADATAINSDNSNASSQLSVERSNTFVSVGNSFITWSCPGVFRIRHTLIAGTIGQSASTFSAGAIFFTFCESGVFWTFSGTSGLSAFCCNLNTGSQNTTTIDYNGSATATIQFCNVNSGTASALLVGAGSELFVINCNITSSNTNAIDGLGSLTFGGLVFNGSSSHINVTTQIIRKEGADTTIGSSNDGGTNTLLVTNTSDTASSSSAVVSSVEGTSAGDATYQAVVDGTQTYTWGIDNDADDTWKLAASAALGSTDVFVMTSTGKRTMPLQPAFCAFLGTTATDVTGDGTGYNLGDTDSGQPALTERFDQGGHFTSGASGGAFFTAPVTGRYQFNFFALYQDLDGTTHRAALSLTTTKEDYFYGNFQQPPAGNFAISFSVLTDMDATDTAFFQCNVNSGAKVIDVFGDATTPRTVVSGYLVA